LQDFFSVFTQGEHTEEILQERLQMSSAEMKALRDKGVI
jgi:crotonobetainyl-CoA:carnitine CoA-transferase CaiB-like acyl-CoA transferase